YLFLLSAVALTIAGYFLLMDAVAVSASHAGATGVSGVGQLGSPMMSGVGVTPEVSGSTYGAPQSAPALPTTAQQPPAPNTPPLPGDLRWEQEIASPPAIRHPTFGGKLSAGRGSRH
ncbi:MAG TPA: hypothetical protein VKQ36_08250, partial [Ktedonobacterales bacterium]|nr:hypothetical protein [Ktedonobacterales bacterium]